jgi:hypothetical protein
MAQSVAERAYQAGGICQTAKKLRNINEKLTGYL